MKNILNKSFLGLKLWYFLLFWVIALVGLILGSIFDLKLSTSIATQGTPFGMFFESWGSVIVTFVGPIGAGIAGKGLIRKGNKPWLIALGILVGVVVVGAVFYFNYKDLKGSDVTNGYGYTVSNVMAAILAIAINVWLYFLGFVLADDDNISPYRLAVLGLAVVLTFGIFQGALNVFKILAGRPRYRFLVWTENAYSADDFRAWWQFSLGHKLDNGGNSDALKSFPSGHTGGIAAFIVVPLILSAIKGTSDKAIVKHISIFVVLALTITMAFARIVNGAHFLSDVSFGAILATLCAFLVALIADKVVKKFPEVNLAKPGSNQ